MIIRRTKDRIYLTTQPDHARASAEIAAAVDPRFFEPGQRDKVIEVTRHHDDGWIEWERAPQRHEDGSPVDFMEMDKGAHFEIWKRGILLAEQLGPFQGAIVARHALSLSEDKPADQVECLTAEYERLKREAWPEASPERREHHVARAIGVLRLADVLQLIASAGWEEPQSATLIDETGQKHRIEGRLTGSWEIQVSDWPFRWDKVVVSIPLVSSPEPAAWDDLLPVNSGDERECMALTLVPSQ